MTLLPEHGPCFVCGSDNHPHNVGLRWYAGPEGLISAEFTLDLKHQGPPGYAHGGASAAILDEAMGVSVWTAGLRGVATNLNVNYKQPVPLSTALKVLGRITARGEKDIETSGEILLPDGTAAATATGVFRVAHHIFENSDLEARFNRQRGE